MSYREIFLISAVIASIARLVYMIFSKESSKRAKLITLFIVATVCVLVYLFFPTSSNGNRWKIFSSKAENSHLAVHVMLPTKYTDENSTIGDGLLQAAGFLVARDQFKDDLRIHWHQHYNNADSAGKIFDTVADTTDLNEPLCFVVTMSAVSKGLSTHIISYLKDHSEVEDRLTVIFTVTSDDEVENDGKCLFQHFVVGSSEADEIVNHVTLMPNPRVVLLAMNTSYPENTIDIINTSLHHRAHVIASVRFDHEGKMDEEGRSQITECLLPEAKFKADAAVIVAYDKGLKAAIELLDSLSFVDTASVYVSTTMSVPAWRDLYTRNVPDFTSRYNLFYTSVDMDRVKTSDDDIFGTGVSKWKFDNITGETELYDAITIEKFTDAEKEVYSPVEPNYLSAFCYDSIYLFWLMKKESKKRLSEVNLLMHPEIYERHRKGAFKEIKIDKDGQTVIIPTLYHFNNRGS